MAQDNRLIIISGLSGSGKTIALHALEDIGYYCIDNMPAGLLRALLDELMRPGESRASKVAVGVDARNRAEDIDALPDLIADIRGSGTSTDVLFLQASDDVLLKRYGETRRPHPLAEVTSELRSAIEQEREILGPVINAADLVIDSSRTSVYELAETVVERVDRRRRNELSILVQSFGFKHGIPADSDFVFDLRCLPNPYWDMDLRSLNGLDPPVAEFLDNQLLFDRMYVDILGFLKAWIPEYLRVNRSYLTVSVGCTGGQHRSVRMAEKLHLALNDMHEPVHVRHNELTGNNH